MKTWLWKIINFLKTITLKTEIFAILIYWSFVKLYNFQRISLKVRMWNLIPAKEVFETHLRTLIKRTTKLYFMYYSRVVSIMFSTGLYKSTFSTYFFDETRFSSFVFRYLWLSIFSFALCFEFNVFVKDLITLYNQGI